MTAAVELKALCKTYKKKKVDPVKAVDNLSLVVPAGKVLGFLGPNGAGKTTTIKMMCGLVKPDSGEVYLNGHNIARERGYAMRQIGAVLEGTRNVYWRLSAWQNLMYFGRLKGRGGAALKPHAQVLLEELELWERRNDPVGQFSRGMQQKVAIACALIGDPPIVLLDEPTLGLDVQAARTIRRWVHKLAAEHHKTVILTTHQLDMAQELCDKINIIHKGRLITDLPIEELLALHRRENYEIKLHGHFDAPYPDWTNGLDVTTENGHTTLSGGITGQTLHALLDHIRQTEYPLVSVQNVQPSLEDIFVQMIEESGRGGA